MNGKVYFLQRNIKRAASNEENYLHPKKFPLNRIFTPLDLCIVDIVMCLIEQSFQPEI